LAILKNCNPKGIPMMVIHHNIPKIVFSMAIGIPQKISQRIFANKEGTPPP